MFNKNKKKLDSKIRWQNPRFKQRLQTARAYKRTGNRRPKSDWEKFFSRIGLGSWVSKILTLAVLFLFTYLVYIPNLFFVKQINILGAANQASVQTTINSFLDKKIPWPQKNLVLMSESALQSFLLEHNQNVLKVNKITKKFPSTLIVEISPRVDSFVVQTPKTAYSISNDGLATNILVPNASGTLPSGLILIKLEANPDLTLGQSALSQSQINFINGLQSQLENIVKSPVSYYEMPNLQTPDLTAHLKAGFTIMFDLSSDLNKTLAGLKLLFSQYSDADIQNLSYVDMRFEGTGYVCKKGAPCVQDTTVPNNNATTTPIN